MKFCQIIEDAVKGKLSEEHLSFKKVEYFKKQKKIRLYCIATAELSSQDEEIVTEHCEKILGGRLEVEIQVLTLANGQVDTKEEMLAFLHKLFCKDPIARNFFRSCEVEVEENQWLFRNNNIIMVNHLLHKKTPELIVDFVKDLFGRSVKVTFRHDPQVINQELTDQSDRDRPKATQGPVVPVAKKVPSPPAPKVTAPVPKPVELKAAPVNDRILYGKAIRDGAMPIRDLSEGMKSATIAGEIFKREDKELRNGKLLVTLFIYDETSSVMAKIFAKDESQVAGIKVGTMAKLKGATSVDLYTKELCLMVNHAEKMEVIHKMDNAPEKRIELHAHTTMSTMDGVVSAKALIKQAKAWGHEAIAITDHGVVQAFPEAMESSGDDIKVIYGMEAYVVNDLEGITNRRESVDFQSDFVVFDIETTGFSHKLDAIIEIGAVKVSKGKVTERFSAFVNPQRPLPLKITELTGITEAMVAGQETIDQVLPRFLNFCGQATLVAHNANFDMGFIRQNAMNLGLPFDNDQWDTVPMARVLYPDLKRHKLDTIAKHLSIFMGSHHRAVDDAETTAQILFRAMERMEELGIKNTGEMDEYYRQNIDVRKPMPDHAIILAKNQAGLKRLYELVSDSELQYFQRTPRIPKSLLASSRENFLIGSACTNSELYRAFLDNRRPQEVEEIAAFYDYLEVQPVSNHRQLMDEGRCSLEELMNYNRQIVKLGEELKKPVVATGDVHMLKASDARFRQIITYCQGFSGGGESDVPLYFRTTQEMLAEFDYLGQKTARELVIEGPRRINDLIEPVLPIPKGTFPPHMEGAEEEITNMTWNKAKAIYGDPLPEIVKARVDRELNSIIGNGYAVLYLVAQKLVHKSLSDGYLVGSRGSVGSSLVATFCDITEVNGLAPHYVCPKCQHSEFFTQGEVASGVDLPEKACPHCGTMYHRDGHDIPFETFLGFEGDKEPDIDLNFSGDNQPAIHKYCEVLFGQGYVFRAGTITTVAEKTAGGYVRKFHEEKGLPLTRPEMERLAIGCTGIKRSTGQHPGGIMVVPSDNDIHNFCPVQHPADDTQTDIITTHFDYHSISGRLLKLDILGHDDPTMLRMLKDITGVDPKGLPLNDEKVLSLFANTSALGIDPEEFGSPVGTAGVPEFGTNFVRQMLQDTHPKNFSDLVRISGLSHGTDVWLNNAQYYIKNGDTDLAGCISLRDNIMLYLISCGMPKKDSFFITEHVRKGKGLKPEEEAEMVQYNVPAWYIESCKKIKYMFPKGHAVAYVTMALRIAWYKVYYPLHYYATYFTVRAKDFDAEAVLGGKASTKAKMTEILAQGNDASPKDQNLLSTLELCYEMQLRGYDFAPLDLYKSRGTQFVVADNSLIVPFSAVNGIGDNAGLAIEEEAKNGDFFSKEDFKKRTKSTRTVMEALDRVGAFKDLGETNQISFF